MITMNCDAHRLLKRLHKPDENLLPENQDKLIVLPIDVADHRTWLTGTIEEASALIRLRHIELYDARPDRPD